MFQYFLEGLQHTPMHVSLAVGSTVYNGAYYSIVCTRMYHFTVGLLSSNPIIEQYY